MPTWTRRGLMAAPVATLALAGVVAPHAARAETADVAAAKREGKVVWYTSTPVDTAQKLANAFEAKYGIKVELFRSGGSAILRRYLQEAQSGRVAVDVLTHSDPAAAQSLARKGAFVAFKPTNFDKVPDAAKDAGGAYVAQRVNLMTIYLRSDKVSPADVPKTWKDLADPKYKGKMVITDPTFTSLQLSVVGMTAKVLGWGYYEALRKNDIMVVQGNQQASDMIKRGERVIAVGASDSYAYDDRKAGHPITTIYPADGTFIIPSPTSILKGSPNPNAAKLLAEYMLSDEAQGLFPEEGNYAARADVRPPDGMPKLDTIATASVDFDYIEKEGARIKRRFAEIMQ